MPRGESKHDRFKRIATRRVSRILRTIESLENLTRPSYQYTEEEINKIFTAIQEATDNAKAKFGAKKRESKAFEL